LLCCAVEGRIQRRTKLQAAAAIKLATNCTTRKQQSKFNKMFGEVCGSNFTYSFRWDNETFAFDHELECKPRHPLTHPHAIVYQTLSIMSAFSGAVSRTVFILFSFIGIAGLVGNALVVLGMSCWMNGWMS